MKSGNNIRWYSLYPDGGWAEDIVRAVDQMERKALNDEYDECRRLASKAVMCARRRYGIRHKVTIYLRSRYLYWMCMSGYDSAAHSLYPPLIRDIEREWGATHAFVWQTRTESALPMMRMQDFFAAARVYKTLIDDMNASLVCSHPWVLQVMQRYGEILACCRRYEESTVVYRHVYDFLNESTDQKCDSVENTRMLLHVRDCIASNAFNAGKYDIARKQWMQLAYDCVSKLGSADPDTVRQIAIQLTFAFDDNDKNAIRVWSQKLFNNIPDTFDKDDIHGFHLLCEEKNAA